MGPPTIVSFYSPELAFHAPRLAGDCERFGYAHHLQPVDRFADLLSAFRFKSEFLLSCVERFDRVLWLDIECRLLKPLPGPWRAPAISQFRFGRRRGWSAGVLLVDRQQRRLLQLWKKYASRHPQLPDDFVLESLAQQLGVEPQMIELGYYDRETTSPIVRGEWSNEHTILIHPTTNRWPRPMSYAEAFAVEGARSPDGLRAGEVELVSRKRKHLFFRNFSGDFDDVLARMREPASDPFTDADWHFEPGSSEYAPADYWPRYRDRFFCKPHSREDSERSFLEASGEVRQRAITRLTLDSGDIAATSRTIAAASTQSVSTEPQEET